MGVLSRCNSHTQFTGEFRWNSPKILKTSMQSRVIILIHDDVGLVVLPAGMYHDVSRFRTLPAFKKKHRNCQRISISCAALSFCNWVALLKNTSQVWYQKHHINVLLSWLMFLFLQYKCMFVLLLMLFSAVHLDDFIWFQCFQCHANAYVIPLNPGCFKEFIYRDCSWIMMIMIILPSGSVSKPCTPGWWTSK